MQIPIFKSVKTGTERINTMEAFNIWNTLRSRYISIETFQFFSNLIHDRDFKLLAGNHLNDFQSQVKVLEKLADTLKVKVPTRPAKEIQFSNQIDQATDRFIFRKFYSDLLSELQSLNNAYRTSTTNDNLRKELKKFLLNHLGNYEDLYKFGKLKGWNDVEPAYKTAKSVQVEQWISNYYCLVFTGGLESSLI